MTAFKLDFEDTFDGEIADGDYEVVITDVKEDATPSGSDFTQFTMTIRNDIDQKHKNMNIFHRVWVAKATGKYNMTMFNTIGKAAQLQNGKEYKSFQELLGDYINRPLRVRVKNESSEYNGKTYENLNVKQWGQTKFPQVQHQFKNKDQGSPFVNESDITTDDLPF